MIKTSYFANWRKFPENYEQISISLYPPKGWNKKELKCFSPSAALLAAYKNHAISEEEYKKVYIQQLIDRGLTPEKVKNMLPENALLLCYEKKGDFCHRHILAEWLKDVEEL